MRITNIMADKIKAVDGFGNCFIFDKKIFNWDVSVLDEFEALEKNGQYFVSKIEKAERELTRHLDDMTMDEWLKITFNINPSPQSRGK